MKSLNKQLDQFPSTRLSPADEAALAGQIQKGSEDAINELVLANMQEALLYTGRCCGGEIDVETRVSLCYQKMYATAKNFQPGKGRFFAFAKAGLRGCLKDHWNSLLVIRNVSGRSMLPMDIPGTWERPARERAAGGKRAPILPDERGGERQVHREYITGEIVDDARVAYMDADQWNTIRSQFKDQLSAQQWMVLDLMYVSGLNCPEIGKLLGVTRAAIHASHQRAIEKLRCGIRKDRRPLPCEDSRA